MNIGDTVICVNYKGWFDECNGKPNNEGPKFKEILKIDEVLNDGYLKFNKWPEDSFVPKAFIKIDGYKNELNKQPYIIGEPIKGNTHKEQKPHSPQNS